MAEQTINKEFYKPSSQSAVPGSTNWLELTYDKQNGNVIIYSYTSAANGAIVGTKTKVYENGVWNAVTGPITTVAEKNSVHNSVIETISRLKGVPGNVIPQFVLEKAPSRDQSTSGEPTISQNSGGIFGQISEAVTSFPKIEEYGTDMAALFKGTPLKYPIDIMDQGQDMLVITQYTYKAPYFETTRNDGGKVNENIFQQGTQRGSALKKKIQQLFLPIPSNVSDSNSANWGGGDTISTAMMAAIGDYPKVAATAAATSAIELVMGTSLGDKITSFGQAAGRGGGNSLLSGVLNTISKNPEAIYAILSGGLNTPGVGQALQALLMNKVGFDISPETILSRGYGIVPNSNLELLFNGPTLRQFVFGYMMSPRSKREAEMCRRILRFFKQGMAPKKKTTGFGGSSYFLATPNVFKLQYRTWDYNNRKLKDIAGLNKFKICALTDLRTSYAPDGPWSAYEEGQPARIQVNFTFKELEPVYESDYQQDINKDYEQLINRDRNSKDEKMTDLDPVKPDEIGY